MGIDWVKMATECGIGVELGEIRGKNGCYLYEMCKDGGQMWKLGWNYGKVVEML